MKRAVIFYSLSGNTKEAAEVIAKELDCDLIAIDLVKALPDGMGKQIMTGGMQVVFGLKPAIKGVPEDIASYDELILGTPVWAGKKAGPVNTLIKKYGVADKITAVFTFSGGGDNDKCIADLQKLLKNMKHSVALADRTNELSGANMDKLKAFIEEIR